VESDASEYSRDAMYLLFLSTLRKADDFNQTIIFDQFEHLVESRIPPCPCSLYYIRRDGKIPDKLEKQHSPTFFVEA